MFWRKTKSGRMLERKTKSQRMFKRKHKVTKDVTEEKQSYRGNWRGKAKL